MIYLIEYLNTVNRQGTLNCQNITVGDGTPRYQVSSCIILYYAILLILLLYLPPLGRRRVNAARPVSKFHVLQVKYSDTLVVFLILVLYYTLLFCLYLQREPNVLKDELTHMSQNI